MRSYNSSLLEREREREREREETMLLQNNCLTSTPGSSTRSFRWQQIVLLILFPIFILQTVYLHHETILKLRTTFPPDASLSVLTLPSRREDVKKQWIGSWKSNANDIVTKNEPPTADVDMETKPYNKSETPTTTQIIIGYSDWPQSQFESRRSSESFRAIVPPANSTQKVNCPQCFSILAGSVMNKKILLLNHELSFAGGEILLVHVAELLEQAGASVRILHLTDMGPLQNVIEERGLSFRFWKDSSGTKQRVDVNSFDVVVANTAAVITWHHFFEWLGTFYSPTEMDQALSRTVFWVHELDVDEYSNNNTGPVLMKVRKVLFDSNAGLLRWKERYPFIADKSHVIHPGVHKQTFIDLQTISNKSVNDFRAEINVTAQPDDVVIMQVASIQKPKGPLELIEGFSLFVNSSTNETSEGRAYHLVFVGHLNVEFRDHFLERVDKVNEHLIHKGTRSRIHIHEATPNIVPYYGAADMIVLNSYCENFGMVIVEAMFAGIPAIARACGGCTEIIEHGKSGWLLETNTSNSEALASVFQSNLSPRDWKQRLVAMGREGSRRARFNFSYAQMARGLSNIFSELFFFQSQEGPSWHCVTSKNRDSAVDFQPLQAQPERTNFPTPAIPNIDGFYDKGCASVGSFLYVFGGYRDLDHVSKQLQAYDMDRNEWTVMPPLPEAAAESHSAIVQDQRFIYIISGQRGSQCSLPVHASFIFDTKERVWMRMPDLPVARYAGCAFILNGRLHFVGGMDIDRRSQRTDHFSISLEALHTGIRTNGTLPSWQREPNIPYGSGHVLCKVLSSRNSTKLYYFGGESEDYYAVNATADDFTCVPGMEWNQPFVHSFDGSKWERIADMPYPLSHAEGSQMNVAEGFEDKAIFIGGSSVHEEELIGRAPILSDGILLFSAETESFHRIGSIYPIGSALKGTCSLSRLSYAEDKSIQADIFIFAGQASASPTLPWAGPIENVATRCRSSRINEFLN